MIIDQIDLDYQVIKMSRTVVKLLAGGLVGGVALRILPCAVNAKQLKAVRGRSQQLAMNKYRAMKGDATRLGVNDIVVLTQEDGSLKASPLQVYIRITTKCAQRFLRSPSCLRFMSELT